MNIFNLTAKLTLDDSEYKKNINEVKKENKDLVKNTKDANLKSILSWGAVSGTIALVANKLKQLTLDATNYAGSIKNMSQFYGESIEKIQELSYVAEKSGKDVEYALKRAKSSGEEYWEVLGLTREQYIEMTNDAHKMGLVLSSEVVEGADALGDSIGNLKLQWKSTLMSLLGGAPEAEEKFNQFAENVSVFLERFTGPVLRFITKLTQSILKTLVKIAPTLVGELIDVIFDTVYKIDWIGFGINLAIKIAEGLVNVLAKIFNKIFGWIGINIPEVNFGEFDTGIQSWGAEYEISEKSTQDITIKIESEGVTENDKKVSKSLEELIDEKLGKMLGDV